MAEPQEEEPPPLDYTRPAPPAVPLYRNVLAGVLALAGLALGGFGLFIGSEPARANTWTAASALVVFGVVIRFQHKRF